MVPSRKYFIVAVTTNLIETHASTRILHLRWNEIDGYELEYWVR